MNEPNEMTEAELDAWIGEHVTKVFHVQPKGGGHYEVWYRKTELNPSGVCCGGFRGEYKAREFAQAHVPKPTTSPADAMAVLEKCAERGLFSIVKQSDGTWLIWPENGTNEIKADTLQMCICRYAVYLFKKD